MWGWLSSIADFLADIVKSITSIPELIFEGIKNIFIPDTDAINERFNSTLEVLRGRIGITLYNLDNIFNVSAAPSDISANYNIAGVGTLNLKFADYTYLAQGVAFFRPYIRGLLVLLLFFFNVRQLLSMFGLDSGEISNAQTNNSKGGTKK